MKRKAALKDSLIVSATTVTIMILGAFLLKPLTCKAGNEQQAELNAQ